MLKNFRVALDISLGWMLGFSLKISGLKSGIQLPSS